MGMPTPTPTDSFDLTTDSPDVTTDSIDVMTDEPAEEKSNCTVNHSHIYVKTDGCVSLKKVRVASCVGSCKSSAVFDPEAPYFKKRCKNCCTPTSFRHLQVKMVCQSTPNTFVT